LTKIEELQSAKLPRQGWGWRYRYGLQELERAYASSRFKSDAELAEIHERASKHQKLVDEGKAAWTEEDEEGYPVYDYGEHLGEQAYEEEQVLNLVRGAFAISLHHYIETTIGPRLHKKKYVHDAAMAWLKEVGWQPDEKVLNQLRMAANCAKHGEGSSAKSLYAERRDMFDERIEGWGSEPSNDTLALSDDHMNEFFKAAREAVPKMPPSF
jgi:hypothetical protein